jgi:hypothetical protein
VPQQSNQEPGRLSGFLQRANALLLHEPIRFVLAVQHSCNSPGWRHARVIPRSELAAPIGGSFDISACFTLCRAFQSSNTESSHSVNAPTRTAGRRSKVGHEGAGMVVIPDASAAVRATDGLKMTYMCSL